MMQFDISLYGNNQNGVAWKNFRKHLSDKYPFDEMRFIMSSDPRVIEEFAKYGGHTDQVTFKRYFQTEEQICAFLLKFL